MLHRKLGAVALLALALVATGCSSAKPKAAPQDPGTPLEIWIRQPPDSESAKTAQRLADAFTRKTGTQTKVVALFDDFETKLQAGAAQKDLPDIVVNDTARLGDMQSKGWLRAVDKAKIAGGGDLADRAWGAAEAPDGKHYAVPFSAQSFGLFVRADWRKKLNLPEPKSWDDVIKLAEAFTANDPDGNGKKDTAGIQVPGGTKRGYMSWYFSSILHANGGAWMTESGKGKFKPAVTDAKAIEAATWMRDWFCKQKVVNADATTADTTVANDSFEKGKTGMYFIGPWLLNRFVKNIGTDKIEVFAIPNGPSGGPGSLAEGENVYLMNGSANEAGQQRFAEFAASAEGQKIGMNADNDGVIVRLPVNKTVKIADVRKDPRWKVFEEAYKTATYSANVPNWTPFRQASADALNAAAANCSTDLKQTMDKLASTFTEELKKQNASAS